MSDGIKVEISKCPDMDAAKDRVIRAVWDAMEAHGGFMEKFAETYVPRRTGDLQDSIEYSVDKGQDTTTIVLSANARSKESAHKEMYGPFVEYGTGQRGMAGGATYAGHTNSDVTYLAAWPGATAQPFLRPALYDTQPVLIANLDRAIKGALE